MPVMALMMMIMIMMIMMMIFCMFSLTSSISRKAGWLDWVKMAKWVLFGACFEYVPESLWVCTHICVCFVNEGKLSLSPQWKKHWFVLTDQSLRFYRDSVAEAVCVCVCICGPVCVCACVCAFKNIHPTSQLNTSLISSHCSVLPCVTGRWPGWGDQHVHLLWCHRLSCAKELWLPDSCE